MDQRSINSLGGGVSGHNFEKIISLENLFLAWKEFKKGKGSKSDVQEFELNLEDNIFQLHSELKNHIYVHSPYTAFYVKDPKLRHIHKACVKDRVLHHAIFRILYPVFDRNFIFDSYSCRIGKGTHLAVDRLETFIRKLSKNNHKTVYALKCDVKKFFDSIDQTVLLNIIKRKIADLETIWLIENIIKSFSKSDNHGLPLGNVTSQLFANIYLNELDQYVKHTLRSKYYIRYCDDFVILRPDKNSLIELAKKIQRFLVNSLGLSLHPNKILIRNARRGIDFLGYVLLPYHRAMRTKTRRRITSKIIKKRDEFESERGLVSEESFRQSLNSYLGCSRHCDGYSLEREIIWLSGLAEVAL